MENNKKYLEIAWKLKALADKGKDGEKYNAQKQLDRIMKKYNITMEMLLVEEQEIIAFKIPMRLHDLFLRIGMSVTGIKRFWGKSKAKRSFVYAKVTRAEEAEIRAKWNFYSRVWEEEVTLFLYAFTNKNELFPKDVEKIDPRSMSLEDLAKLRKVLELSRTLTKAHYTPQLKDENF